MKKIIVLNGSPRKQGTIATLLRVIADSAASVSEIEWIDVNELTIKPCRGCMKCRQTKRCVLPVDDGHLIGEKISRADAIVIGSPVYWGNMNGYMKVLFDRISPLLMGETEKGIPIGLQKGKKAVIVTACTTPGLFDLFAGESRGAIKALKEILFYSGYKVLGKIVKPGTRIKPVIQQNLIKKAEKLGRDLVRP